MQAETPIGSFRLELIEGAVSAEIQYTARIRAKFEALAEQVTCDEPELSL